MAKKIRNFTEESITIYGQRGVRDEPQLTVESEGNAQFTRANRRIQDESGEFTDAEAEVMLMRMTFENVIGLPDPDFDVVIVSTPAVAQAAAAVGRTDVFFPILPLRDAEGRIAGHRFLTRYSTSGEE